MHCTIKATFNRTAPKAKLRSITWWKTFLHLRKHFTQTLFWTATLLCGWNFIESFCFNRSFQLPEKRKLIKYEWPCEAARDIRAFSSLIPGYLISSNSLSLLSNIQFYFLVAFKRFIVQEPNRSPRTHKSRPSPLPAGTLQLIQTYIPIKAACVVCMTEAREQK